MRTVVAAAAAECAIVAPEMRGHPLAVLPVNPLVIGDCYAIVQELTMLM